MKSECYLRKGQTLQLSTEFAKHHRARGRAILGAGVTPLVTLA
jgi:hypothetical protein